MTIQPERLMMSFEPRTVEHLGLQMYSQLPAALAELVANAYDADATEAIIDLTSEADGEAITVIDNGHGMSADDLDQKYLRIGRNRRETENSELSESGRRRISGKKGIGKLALFGIGKVIKVETKRENVDHSVRLTLSWNDMMKTKDHVYFPDVTSIDSPPSIHGTTITITALTRRSIVNPENLARSMSRLVNYVGDFRLIIRSGSKAIQVTPALRFSDDEIQFRWTIPHNLPDQLAVARDHFNAHGIEGEIVSTRKTLRQDNRGAIVFINGRRANAAEFYGANESSYAFSYLSGVINADYLDDLESDVIATDRASINWDLPETQALNKHLAEIVRWVGQDWRRRRELEKRQRTEKRSSRDFASWTTNQRGDDGQKLDALLDSITSSDVEMPEDVLDTVLDQVESLVPEYARLHWRHLHPEVQRAAKDDYGRKDYIRAVEEAFKAFSREVRTKSGTDAHDDDAIMTRSFSMNSPLLDVAGPFLPSRNSGILTESTITNIRNGQMNLARGLVSAFRNPLAHNEKRLAVDIGMITDNDCLDFLSLLSHLWHRLDGAIPAT